MTRSIAQFVRLDNDEFIEVPEGCVALDNGVIKAVPDGADPEAFRKFENDKLRTLQNPKRRKRQSRRGKPGGGRRGSKSHRASDVIFRSMAAQLDRVNGDDEPVSYFVNNEVRVW